ncbi:MAG: Smr/MutS family protein [Proteobacteria bacterium]|nr:Smr/MutS family protein [Pseudomonadota bacterium]
MTRKPVILQDHGLWDDVRRTIKPLRRVDAAIDITPAGSKLVSRPVTAPARIQAVPPRRGHVEPPPLGNFDRRLAQRLSRGQLEPDARIDLHGDGLEVARIKLYHFLEQRRRDGVRLVLVITGKGASPFARHTLHGMSTYHSPEREGRLRREVPMWLHENIFRVHVIGYQPAHPRHGGGGAYYVRLRQAREDA